MVQGEGLPPTRAPGRRHGLARVPHAAAGAARLRGGPADDLRREGAPAGRRAAHGGHPRGHRDRFLGPCRVGGKAAVLAHVPDRGANGLAPGGVDDVSSAARVRESDEEHGQPLGKGICGVPRRHFRFVREPAHRGRRRPLRERARRLCVAVESPWGLLEHEEQLRARLPAGRLCGSRQPQIAPLRGLRNTADVPWETLGVVRPGGEVTGLPALATFLSWLGSVALVTR
mmetsp:Transcript_9018/g.23350  ORF Transcript_9018/g.23350 Transcript_9018/m.23350 type:complete len:229 (-) Transcript_9018:262-948(-)